MKLHQPIGWGLGLNSQNPEMISELLQSVASSMDWMHGWRMLPTGIEEQYHDKWFPEYFGYRWPPPETKWPKHLYENDFISQEKELYDFSQDCENLEINSDYWPFTDEELAWVENRVLFCYNEPAYGWAPPVKNSKIARQYYHIIHQSLMRYRWEEEAKGREVDILLAAPSENIILHWYDWLIEFLRGLRRNSSIPHIVTLHMYSMRDSDSILFLKDRLKNFMRELPLGRPIVITEASPGPGLAEEIGEEKAITHHLEAMDALREILDWPEIMGVAWFAAFDQKGPGSSDICSDMLYWGLYNRPKLLDHWIELGK